MSRLAAFLLSNCNCLTSALRVGQPNGLVVPDMPASPSHDERGDAASAAAAPDIKALDSFTESGGGNSQAAGDDRPPPPLLQQQDREQQQQQPQPKQQHLPLATGESEGSSVEYDSDDSITIISDHIGYPPGPQEQQGRKEKNATQSSVAVKGQSNVGPEAIKSSFYWAFAKGNAERTSHYN